MLQITASIDINMRCEFVSPGARQVIDQRDVAKVILTLPVESMGLKRITPVWAEEYQSTAGFQGSHDLSDRCLVVLDMFQNLMAQDQIETIIRKGEGFANTVDHPAVVDLCLL